MLICVQPGTRRRWSLGLYFSGAERLPFVYEGDIGDCEWDGEGGGGWGGEWQVYEWDIGG